MYYQATGDNFHYQEINMPLSVEDSGCDIIPVVSEKNIATGAVVCTSEKHCIAISLIALQSLSISLKKD